MLHAFLLLIVLQLAGEAVVRGADLPVPGPVVGMLLLLAGLALRARLAGGAPPPEAFERTCDGLLRNLSLLFVPAGVGVVLLVPVLADEGPAIAAALLASTLVCVAVTALAMVGVDRLLGGHGGGGSADGVREDGA
jgi:holin-like protein